MNHIDILDYEIDINGKKLVFPMSYEDIKESLGEARIEDDRFDVDKLSETELKQFSKFKGNGIND